VIWCLIKIWVEISGIATSNIAFFPISCYHHYIYLIQHIFSHNSFSVFFPLLFCFHKFLLTYPQTHRIHSSAISGLQMNLSKTFFIFLAVFFISSTYF
jgi:hypothetical protein